MRLTTLLLTVASYGIFTAAQSSTDDTVTIPSDIIALADEYSHEFANFDCLFTSRELLEHALFYIESLIYPNNVAEAQSINSTVFAEDIVGRVDISGTYIGRELNTEYSYGLFLNVMSGENTNIIGYPTTYEMYEFTGECDQYSVSFVLNATLAEGVWFPMEIDLWVKLNEKKQITQYDASLKRFPLIFDWLMKMTNYGISGVYLSETESLTTEQYAVIGEALASSICAVHDQYCTGENLQYSSNADCMGFLTEAIRFGTAMEGGKNTLLCRSLHQNMVALRPSVHCPHIGPSGGDMCVDDEATELFNVVYNFNYIFGESFIAV